MSALPMFLPSETLREQVRLHLAGVPTATSHDIARHFRVSAASACNMLRTLMVRDEAVYTEIRVGRARKRVRLWRLLPNVPLASRIFEALDAPREAWGIAKSVGAPEARVETVLVMLKTDGIVRQSGEMWARVSA